MKNHGLSGLYKTAAAFLTALALVLCVVPATGRADGGCDPLYMKALKGRAYSESKRESSQNKNLIYKEDATLEYSCIFSHLSNIATQTGPDMIPVGEVPPGIVTTPVDVPTMDISGIPIDLEGVSHMAVTPVWNLLGNSFGHTYLGGHFKTGTPETRTGAYFCDAMARMWEFSRCINMHQFTNAESFFDFKFYEGDDPRKYPPEYQVCVPAVQAIDLKSSFRGLEDTWLLTNPDTRPDGNQYGTDPVTTYLKLTNWDVDPDNCGDPIPTGLTIYRKNGQMPEEVCAKPGCVPVCEGCEPGRQGKWVCKIEK